MTREGFKDYFSAQAPEYARYRVRYPPELFKALADLSPGRARAWDCGTGSGQAAWGLAEHFDAVVATDPSAEQIKHAAPHPKISYRVEPAERSGLEDRSVDLITAAQAAHWFRLDKFWNEARRVAKPGAILAVWCYELPRVTPEIDAVVRRYEREVLRGYWAPEIAHVWSRYRDLGFPFPHLELPSFSASSRWTLDDLLGHLRTWSASRRYREREGRDPSELVLLELRAAWGEAGRERPVSWPIDPLMAGRIG